MNNPPNNNNSALPKLNLVLASESPRRKSLLQEAGFSFEVFPVQVSEFFEKNLTADAALMKISKTKAHAALTQYKPSNSGDFTVLAADTMVFFEGRALGKPKNSTEAEEFLGLLSGKIHEVKTSITLVNSKNRQTVSQVSTTKVHFRLISRQEILDYIASGEPMDKAGAYAIQGIGGKFVVKIEGDYDNVVGLPIKAVKELMIQAADRWAFYKNLKSFSDFTDIVDDQYFQNVPEDWIVVLTDVRGSTKAIQAGRYKQVNIIGAASITCIINALKTNDFPFVFGGDGATLLIPQEFSTVVQSQLLKLQAMSKKDFDLELRVGIVPLKKLYESGYILKIGKYELSEGNYLAQFRGEALTRAEDMVKKNEAGALILTPGENEGEPALEGLTCRLNPLKSKKGKIVSLLCKPIDSKTADVVLRDVMQKLLVILDNDFKTASPVDDTKLKWKWIPDTFNDERKLKKAQSTISQIFWLLLQNMSMKFGVPLGRFSPEKYKSELIQNSDFKKFDETLRMVIDCTDAQVNEIEKLLAKQFQERKIYYGIHKSTEALMTCVVFSATTNQHVHFIDGANGGYAMAASEMKKQMAQALL